MRSEAWSYPKRPTLEWCPSTMSLLPERCLLRLGLGGEHRVGVTNSHLAIREMVQPKFVLYDSNKDPEVWWFPATDQAISLARTTLAWLTAKPLSKLGKTFNVLGAMKERIQAQKSMRESIHKRDFIFI